MKSMHRYCLSCILFGLWLSGCTHRPAPAFQGDGPAFDPGVYRSMVEKLCDRKMEGRGVSTEGNRRATEFLAGSFRDAGLEPGGDRGTYLQCFQHPVAVRAEKLLLAIDGREVPAGAISPAPFSSSGDFEGELVFGGYGIHAPDEGYDDYASLDARDKVLLLFRYEPREKDSHSPLNGDKPSRFSDLRRKVFEAKNRGAAAVIFTSPPRQGEKPENKVLPLRATEAQSQAGLPVLHVMPARADEWLRARGTSMEQLVAAIDAEFSSRPVSLGRVRGEVRMARQERELCNVVGILPGSGRLAAEGVVIGAHFDHLGTGQSGSMVPGHRAVHPGADDNASGVAGLISLALHLKGAAGPGSRRSIVFVAFNAEEVGLAGSATYVTRPAVELGRTSAMLNLDMIGRLRDGRLVVMGTETGAEWSGWLENAARRHGLELITSGDGYGPSDHTPFYAREVPVLHFFTGTHQDHHKPSDTADKVNYPGALKVLHLVADLVIRTATEEPRVAYRKTSAGPLTAGDARDFGAWLGTVPDYTAMSPTASGGVLLSDVRKDGPAEQAGIRKGDRIVAMGGRSVDNLYDMTFVLRDHRPGEVLAVKVVRNGKTVELAATLGSRSAMQGSKKGGHPHGRSGHPGSSPAGPPMNPETLLYPGEEKHLKNLTQLTFEGENAEAYFSPDGKRLVFQARAGGVPCDRIYTLDLRTRRVEQVSSGKGRTTCAYFTYPGGESIFYSSTHLAGDACPPEPDRSKGFVWPVYPSYDIFLRRPDGEVVRLTDNPGYDAEATACFTDGRIVFTSLREGDLDLYVLDPERPSGKPVRITSVPGYDGGAYFSPDCSRLVWRAARPQGKELDAYRDLLQMGLIRPFHLELMVARADGSDARQVTHNGAANFAPYFLPDNRRIIFSSNLHNQGGHNFDLFVVDPDAEDPDKSVERITFSPVFESFPMFSPDGKKLVFASNRNGKKPGDTNIFIAEWVE